MAVELSPDICVSSYGFLADLDAKYGTKQLPYGNLIIPPGFDSDAYKFGQTTLKLYTPEIVKEKLEFYKEITNKAAFLSELQDWKITFRYSKVTFPLRVNRYDELVYWQNRGCFVGMSCYVGGRRLGEAGDIIDLKEIRSTLGQKSLQLDKELGVYGVNLVPINVRLKEAGVRYLIITDLCAEIGRLKKTER